MNGIAHVLGLDSATGAWYLWWSGVAGNIALIGAALTVIKRHRCHVTWCLRIARHRVEGTPYVSCSKHHPDVPKKISESDFAVMEHDLSLLKEEDE